MPALRTSSHQTLLQTPCLLPAWPAQRDCPLLNALVTVTRIRHEMRVRVSDTLREYVEQRRTVQEDLVWSRSRTGDVWLSALHVSLQL